MSATVPPDRTPATPDVGGAVAPQLHVRLGQGADAGLVSDWLERLQPLPVPAARARQLMLGELLAQSGRGICLLACLPVPSPDGGLVACLPVALLPSLELAGFAACASEWWVRPELDAATRRACLEACCATLADWGRAHGIRHALLAPGLAAGHGGAPPGFSLHANGMWHGSLAPAAKVLG
ncbi:hypothetical protein [Cupriavidus taiwanensis]|uniref:GNAT family N-acetyltransferase n=1 Tax=Cupriavidus taiwanensis TaxID=164546 RepID=A0A7Z7J516_9BURK|nr:hypothetical protein [Cupriavidus taiwanensis]SOY90327.1 conserved hypothetical protein [Cupriavidus taiwanensis]SOZ00630.1 conserved hypothetical protein [Cupriavidus taiwanensis]SOZ03716.1 conserved hypothetical protein [Cupriavidus taiwanensis]SPC07949.1 conserved hypothetical protein [Cupriavidus taiwanensis]SPD42372.1 conserved protein of unknown function [Cupriavidus taiwanensis]